MLTDAEMQKLLDARAEAGDALSYMLGDCAPHVEAYIVALDSALPRLVEEVRRLRKAMADRPFAKPPRESYHQDKGAFNE